LCPGKISAGILTVQTFLSFSTAQTHAMIAHRMQACHLPSTSFYIQDSFFHLILNHIYEFVVIRWTWEPGLHSCYGLDDLAFNFWQEQEISLFSKMYNLGLVLAQPPLQWVVEVKNERSYTPTPLIFWVLARLQRPDYCLLIGRNPALLPAFLPDVTP
jgi:hypothetical protein